MTANTIWRSGTNAVFQDKVRTRRMTVALDDIDVVEVRRPLLPGACVLALACLGLGGRFGDLLEVTELASLMGLACSAVLAGAIVARLQLHSLSIQGIAITLPVWTAHAMRNAIDLALADRSNENQPVRRRVSP